MKGNVRITQTGRYVPQKIVTNDDLSKIMDTSDEWIHSRTGIKERRVATTENTSDLCSQVAKNILEKADLDATEIDFIIVATMTPDYLTPSTACLVQAAIGATKAFAFDVSAACSGFVYGLSIAEKFLISGKYQKGLVIGGETLSKALDWEDRSTAVLFGDGAAGALVELTTGDPQFLAEAIHSDGSRGLNLTSGYSENHNPFKEETPKEREFHGLAMAGREIFDFGLRDVSKNILEVLEKAELSKEEIDYILPHQANTRIIDGMAKKIKIPREKFLMNIQNYGNTSAATIPILLDESLENGQLVLGSNQKVVLTGFGGGLTWGSILLSL